MKKDEQYKSIGEGEETRASSKVGEGSGRAAIDELRNEILTPLENDIHKFRDPVVIAALMHTVATEKENTNRLLRTLIEKLDTKFAEVESRLSAIEQGMTNPPPDGAQTEEILLSSVDGDIRAFVKEKRYASAEEVRKRFGYKGKNAASARLNKMFEMGLLSKKQVGRAVLYCVKS